MQNESLENNSPPDPAQAPPREVCKSEVTSEIPPAKRLKFIPEGINQADIDAVLNRLARMRKRLKRDILFVGGRLAKMRDQVTHGHWGTLVERTFPLTVRTANNWIRAWEGRNSELALSDWDEYMRAIYGNEPKKLKAPKRPRKPKEEEKDLDDEDEDEEQSGGEGFGRGLGEPSFFADKGKAGFYGLKKLAASLDREFFDSENITLEAKLSFVTELSNWLEARRKILAARLERKAEQK